MLSYRRELDGLRALAVIAVIVYHANLKLFGVQLFQGGFFGVDVFFVLSGYLITGIIRDQMEQGTFSFRDFYWRRAKRIVPALLTMLLVTSGLAYLILLPDDLVVYAQSLQSALYFGSNHFFYGEDSYTATASIYRPLLHTWSLSVEWQFYVVFPFVVWVINRFFPRYMFGMLLALGLLSLQVSSFIVKVNPDMAFYLLPTRAWELILGGLVTFYNRTNIESSEKGSFAFIAYQSLPIIGLFLVVHSMIFIGHEVPHPSFITLLPVLGTCLFIMFSHKGEVSYDVMSFKPIVGIGLISYSLYLWHQPVFVFFRLIKHDYFRYEQFALLLFISIVMAYISYRFVESKFRNKQSETMKLTSITTLFIVNVCVCLYIYDGAPNRFKDINELIKSSERVWVHDGNERCHSGGGGRPFFLNLEESCFFERDSSVTVITLGDSHAGSLSDQANIYAKRKGYNFIQVSSAGCTHIPNLQGGGCDERAKKVVEFIRNIDGKKYLIYNSRLPKVLEQVSYKNPEGGTEGGYRDLSKQDLERIEKNKPSRMSMISNFISTLSKNVDRMLVVYPVPEHGYNPRKEIMKLENRFNAKNITQSVSYGHFKNRTKSAYTALDGANGSNITRVYPEDYLCDKKLSRCYSQKYNELYYTDDNHLGPKGAKMILDAISKHLK
jgi:peptidoglycan/LPS O-acetylase OafA/YrhL